MNTSIELINLSESIIKTMGSLPNDPNSIIVYDIDDTLIESRNRTPIQPILYTYRYAKDKGLKTAIITARRDLNHNINLTKKELERHGIADYSFMYFLPEGKRDQSKYKLLARKNLHDRGYKVLMSIGDAPWDIGEYGGIGFTVPMTRSNPD